MIAVDYDGTIVEHQFPASGPLKKGAKEALTRFRELGYHVIIYSCRSCKWFPEHYPQDRYVADMVETLAKHEIPYDEIDDGTKGKPPADFYIDDKGVRFSDNWGQITRYVTAVTNFQKEAKRG